MKKYFISFEQIFFIHFLINLKEVLVKSATPLAALLTKHSPKPFAPPRLAPSTAFFTRPLTSNLISYEKKNQFKKEFFQRKVKTLTAFFPLKTLSGVVFFELLHFDNLFPMLM